MPAMPAKLLTQTHGAVSRTSIVIEGDSSTVKTHLYFLRNIFSLLVGPLPWIESLSVLAVATVVS